FIEMMKEVGEKNEVVVLAEIDIEGAAMLEFEPVADAEAPGVLSGNLENGGPVDRDHARFGDGAQELDAEHPVTRGDIDDLSRPIRRRGKLFGKTGGNRSGEGDHG